MEATFLVHSFICIPELNLNVVVSGYIRDIKSSRSGVLIKLSCIIYKKFRNQCNTEHSGIDISITPQLLRIITAMSKNMPEFHMLCNQIEDQLFSYLWVS